MVEWPSKYLYVMAAPESNGARVDRQMSSIMCIVIWSYFQNLESKVVVVKKSRSLRIAFFNLILIALALDVDEILIWFTTAPRFNTQALQDSLNLGQAKDKNQSQYLHVTSPLLNYFCDRKFRLKTFFQFIFLLEMNLCLLVVALVRLKHEKLVLESIKKYTQSTLWRSDYVLRVVKMCKMPREPWNLNTHTQQTTKARKRRLQG